MYRFLLLLGIITATSICFWTGASWWSPALAAAALGFLLPVWKRGGFWYAFLGGLITYGVYTGYLHFDSEGALTDRLAVTFGFNSGWALVGITAMWGAITTGLGGFCGASLRRAVRGRNSPDKAAVGGDL